MDLCRLQYLQSCFFTLHPKILKLLLYIWFLANIRIEQETTREIEIKKGIRQECILSPIFFHLYSEDIINRALSEQNTGIKANGISINNLR